MAPVCKMVPSVVLQNVFNDCEVAVKTLPTFADDRAKSDFMQVQKWLINNLQKKKMLTN